MSVAIGEVVWIDVLEANALRKISGDVSNSFAAFEKSKQLRLADSFIASKECIFMVVWGYLKFGKLVATTAEDTLGELEHFQVKNQLSASSPLGGMACKGIPTQ